MKNIVHLFSKETIINYLNTPGIKIRDGKKFELTIALAMHRLYEDQWQIPVMIGFYMRHGYSAALMAEASPQESVLVDALHNGIEEDNQIDFILSTYQEEGGSLQEFQLKRYGVFNQPSTTENLIVYLEELKKKYEPMDATLLVALEHIETINFPKLRDGFDKEHFPFTELLLIGQDKSNFIIAGILPEEGWSSYKLVEFLS